MIEQYWAPFRRHAVGDVASAQKSVTSLLVGILEAQGALRLDDPVARYLGAAGRKRPRQQESAITLRHLLTMTSGLSDSFTFEAAAGTRWSYNTSAYQMLHRVVERASGKPLDDFTRTALAPLGWQDTVWRDRPNMTLPDGSPARGLAMSSRDAARFGLLALAGGAGRASRWCPEPYLPTALASSTTLNPSYGYLWWLNGKDGYVLPGPSILRKGRAHSRRAHGPRGRHGRRTSSASTSCPRWNWWPCARGSLPSPARRRRRSVRSTRTSGRC